MSQTHKKTRLIALVLVGLIFLNVNFVSAAVNQTLKDTLLPYVDIKYDYANGVIDEVIIYNRALSSDEINALYSLSPQGMGETWNCTIKAIDSTGAEGINSKAITMPGYALPNITGIKITPSLAYTDSTLNCSAVYGDPDGNKGNVTLSWYNGSSLFWQTTQYNKFSGESVNEPLTWADRNGLVGYWKFSEGNGTIARDISGNENNGALTNFNFNANDGWVEGKYGKALKFDGINDNIRIPYTSSLNTSDAGFTVSAWFKRNIKDEYNADAIVGNWQWDSNVTNQRGWVIRYYINTSYLQFEIDVTNGTAVSERVPGYTTPSDNTWYHIVGTFNPSTRQSILYVNGIARSTDTAPAGFNMIAIDGKKDIRIGTNEVNNGWFNGSMDEVMIFNRTLSSGEISEIYNNSPQAVGETWNCTINAIDSVGMTGLPTSKAITIGSQSAQNYTSKWVHVSVTYNKATKQKKIYVNGNLTRTETLSGLGDYKINNQTGNLYAGKLNGLPAGNPFNGSIDEIMIFPNEKSAAEIWQDYLNNIIYGEMPGPNEAKTMMVEGENITEISIAPIVRVSNKEKTCDVTSKVKLPECVQ